MAFGDAAVKVDKSSSQFLQDHTEYHRMQCNFPTTCIHREKFVTFARLTTFSQLYPCGISLLRIASKKCKRLSEEYPFEQFWRWKPLEFTGERSHSGLEKSYQTKFCKFPQSMATQPRSLHCGRRHRAQFRWWEWHWHYRNWARWRRPSHLQCCDVHLLGPYMPKVLSSPFLFYPFLFSCLVKAKLYNQSKVNNDSTILNLLTSKNWSHGRKGPTFTKGHLFFVFADF